ncbi:hypothetical protein V5740_03285 [Croceibacterium sp. TMG7-5b_MA50]|uniref:hypothetical protein n=1 Tax=Croceibacterium sp. TMG7-5b_MA50 TaxID=3121290 RepID=UPI003221D182
MLVGFDERRAVRLDNPVDELLDCRVELLELDFEAFGLLPGLRQPSIPQIAEHGRSQLHQLGRRPQLFEQRSKVSFQLLAPDRLAVGHAALLHAEVIRIFCGAARGPAGHELMSTAAAGDESAQRKVFAQVGFRGHVSDRLHAALDGAEGLEAD